MLRVFVQAALLPGGERLAEQGEEVVLPAAARQFAGYDPAFTADVSIILGHLTQGLISRFAAGHIDVTGIVDEYERAVRRLTGGVSRVDEVLRGGHAGSGATTASASRHAPWPRCPSRRRWSCAATSTTSTRTP